jgi:hypothetical protein
MGDKMMLNGAAGADRWLWGLNAPFRSGAPEQRARAAWRGREGDQKAVPIGAEWAVRRSKTGRFSAWVQGSARAARLGA